MKFTINTVFDLFFKDFPRKKKQDKSKNDHGQKNRIKKLGVRTKQEVFEIRKKRAGTEEKQLTRWDNLID